jgi:hypothetical protein
MPSCIICGNETKLQVGNRAICVKCDESSAEERASRRNEKERGQKDKPDDSEGPRSSTK